MPLKDRESTSMYQIDLAVEFFGRRTARILRVIGLFPDGVDTDFVRIVVGGKAARTRHTIDRLIAAGLLRQDGHERVSLNRESVYWPGVVLLLDLRVNLVRLISALAADLAGPGTKVALHGSRDIESALYEADKEVLFIRPIGHKDHRISLWDEALSVIPTSGPGVFLDLEAPDQLRTILDSGSPKLLRSWLRGDDIQPDLTVGTNLLATEREVPISQLRRTVPNAYLPASG
ncbi:MAG: hypothetical protein ABWX92_15245 [Mycetocola sp.]